MVLYKSKEYMPVGGKNEVIDMNDLAVRQMEEAVKRMRMLKMFPACICDFREGKLNRSENGGILFWLNEEEKQMVENFEKEYGGKVFHVIKNYMRESGNPCYSMLYVSAEEEEWELDRADLEEGYPYAYVVGDYGEIGSIGVKPQWGGLVRTA